MALLYIAAGINHFLHPAVYIEIMPHWLPAPKALVYITGIFEIVLGIMLVPLITRRTGAWGIILLLIIILPANVQMMLNYLHEGNPRLWISILRLPLQLLLIWWAYGLTKLK